MIEADVVWRSLSTQEKLALIDWALANNKVLARSIPNLVTNNAVFDVTINGHPFGKLLNGLLGSKNVRGAWADATTDVRKNIEGGKVGDAIAKTCAWIGIEDRIRELGQIGIDHLRSGTGPYAGSIANKEADTHSSHAYRQPLEEGPPAENGLEKWMGEHHFISCCGVWWSRTTWNGLPNYHATGSMCSKCKKLVLRAKENPDDHAAYAQRLSETEPGSWIQFGDQQMVPIAVGAVSKIIAQVWQPYMVSHLAIPERIADSVRVYSLQIGIMTCVHGPVPGGLFAVRIPEDVKRPIDRGGSIGKKTLIVPGLPAILEVHNKSLAPVVFEGALFGKSIDEVPMSPPQWAGHGSSRT